MHPENLHSEDSHRRRTKPDLERARELLLRHKTRAAKLKARKEALGLYVRALPEELLTPIFHCFLYMLAETPAQTGPNSLAACSLVCRRWSREAQIKLHEHPKISAFGRLELFHRTLMSSDLLGGRVRRLVVRVVQPDPDNEEPPIPLDQMFAECLERTPNLEMLYLDIQPRNALSDAIIQRLASLPQLGSLQLNQGNRDWQGGPVHTSGFDPMLLQFLPSSIQRFSLTRPFRDVMQALPAVLQRIYPAQEAGPLAGAAAHPNGSLKLLAIMTDVIGTSNAIDFPALISTTSIPATLSTLLLRLPSQVDNDELQLWNNFIRACSQLKEIDINVTLAAPSIFNSMPPVKTLQVLKIDLQCRPAIDEWNEFSKSIVDYVAKTPGLTEFSLRAHLGGYTENLIDRFIHHLLPSFCTEDRCRLRSFSLSDFNPPTLDKIEQEGAERIYSSSSFTAPFISTVELLCTRAVLLEHLAIAVPLDFLPRVTRALERLQHLQTAILHNYSLEIDPAIPLSKVERYKHFLFCCRVLKQYLRR